MGGGALAPPPSRRSMSGSAPGCLECLVDLRGGDDRRHVADDEGDDHDDRQRSRRELGQVDGVARREQHDRQPDEDERQTPADVAIRPATRGLRGRGLVGHGVSSCSMNVGNLVPIGQLISFLIITP